MGVNIWLKGRLMTTLSMVSLDWKPTGIRTLTNSLCLQALFQNVSVMITM